MRWLPRTLTVRTSTTAASADRTVPNWASQSLSYVSLVVATVRPERPSPSQDAAVSDSTERQQRDNDTDELGAVVTEEASADPSAPTQDDESVASPVTSAADTTDDALSSAAIGAHAVSVMLDDPTEASTAAHVKPRYTARTDMRFPMSTVAVYADPTQLS